MFLDSLYEEGASRRQSLLHGAGYSSTKGYNYSYGTSPHNAFVDQRDHPYAMSTSVASPPADARMIMMSPQHQMAQQQYQMMMQQQQQQQYQMMMQQQQYQMMMTSHTQNQYTSQYPHQQQQLQQQQMQRTGSMNPFGDPFSLPQGAMPPQGNRTLF